MELIILAGGLGTRIRPIIGEIPKPLARVGALNFLEIMLAKIDACGIVSKVILATGYKSELFNNYANSHRYSFEIVLSPEESPLGTGGALQQASELLEGNNCLVMNGDTFIDVSKELFFLLDKATRKVFSASMCVCPASEDKNYGSILMDPTSNIITAFCEKKSFLNQANSYVSAGLYSFSVKALRKYGRPISSIEYDLIPSLLLNKKSILGIKYYGKCLDIGTPENFKNAESYIF